MAVTGLRTTTTAKASNAAPEVTHPAQPDRGGE